MKSFDWESQANSTQRLATLKRNLKPASVSGAQQQLIAYIAKVRLLQDELFAQKMKNQTMQRKNIQYIETIAQLQYTIGDLKFMLQKADVQIRRHKQIDRQIQNYAYNLKQVGQELTTLNEVLQKKNKQCQKLIQSNLKLKQQNNSLQLKIKEMDHKSQVQRSKIRQLVQLVTIDNQPSFNEDLARNATLIEEGITDLKSNLLHTKSLLEKSRKQNSQNIIKQKQKIIQLQYALKLSQKRNQDLEKKKKLQSEFIIDKKVQDMIQQMLKKQDQLISQISILQQQLQLVKSQLQNEKESNSHYIQLKKKLI